MTRMTALFSGTGLLLGVLAAIGWHFQPVFPSLGAARPLSQVLEAATVARGDGGPLYSGVVAYEDMSWWHEPTWVPVLALLATGGLTGVIAGALVARTSRTRTRWAAAVGLGLVLGGAGAVGWHWEPDTPGVWNGTWFWPVDALYPVVGMLVALSVTVLSKSAHDSEQ